MAYALTYFLWIIRIAFVSPLDFLQSLATILTEFLNNLSIKLYFGIKRLITDYVLYVISEYVLLIPGRQ